jgi:plasmid stabilization system protein ParE
MAAKSLDIHPSALAELKSSISWYLEQSEAAAAKFVEEPGRRARSSIDLVLASPRRWPTSDLGTRKFVLLRFPYAVIYHERKSVVRILAIAHGHRRPGYWKDRV